MQTISRSVVIWLWLCAAMVFAMANIGAVTRLTESGLSITYWEPVKGAVPPLSDADWVHEFARYQTSPQFQKINQTMTLGEFKHIFWWEWLHRQWGRLIGLVYAAGLLWFWVRGDLNAKNFPPPFEGGGAEAERGGGGVRVPELSLNIVTLSDTLLMQSATSPLQGEEDPESSLHNSVKLKLLGILLLGGLQGVVGWYMVKSGLINNPAVSHYRLAAHLLLAAALYVGLIWMALDASSERRAARRKAGEIANSAHPASRFSSLYKHGIATIAVLLTTITYGAFVAGLRAGLLYNTWPLMGGHYMPPDFWAMQPWWKNILENHAAVQFVHRNLAYLTALMGLALAVQGWRKAPHQHLKKLSAAIGAMVLLQACLGIVTILIQVQIVVAVAHQAGAFLLLGLLVCWLHAMHKAIQAQACRGQVQ